VGGSVVGNRGCVGGILICLSQDMENDFWLAPGSSMKTWEEGKNYLIPPTDAIKDLLCEMEKVNSKNGIIFASLSTQEKHVYPASIIHSINVLACNFVKYEA
jgi:hypothetical protein